MQKLSSLFLALAILCTHTPIRSENWSGVFWMTFTAFALAYYLKTKLNSPEKPENTQDINQATSQKSV